MSPEGKAYTPAGISLCLVSDGQCPHTPAAAIACLRAVACGQALEGLNGAVHRAVGGDRLRSTRCAEKDSGSSSSSSSGGQGKHLQACWGKSAACQTMALQMVALCAAGRKEEGMPCPVLHFPHQPKPSQVTHSTAQALICDTNPRPRAIDFVLDQ
jgi:hypothetical protein